MTELNESLKAELVRKAKLFYGYNPAFTDSFRTEEVDGKTVAEINILGLFNSALEIFGPIIPLLRARSRRELGISAEDFSSYKVVNVRKFSTFFSNYLSDLAKLLITRNFPDTPNLHNNSTKLRNSMRTLIEDHLNDDESIDEKPYDFLEQVYDPYFNIPFEVLSLTPNNFECRINRVRLNTTINSEFKIRDLEREIGKLDSEGKFNFFSGNHERLTEHCSVSKSASVLRGYDDLVEGASSYVLGRVEFFLKDVLNSDRRRKVKTSGMSKVRSDMPIKSYVNEAKELSDKVVLVFGDEAYRSFPQFGMLRSIANDWFRYKSYDLQPVKEN